MATIDVLSVDDLLIIFNLLTLYDKLIAMRVCKTWYNMIKDTHAWKTINFCDKGPVKEDSNETFDDDDDWEDDEIYAKSIISKHQGKPSVTFKKFNKYSSYWFFPATENDTVTFLDRFAGKALQEVFLTFVSQKVMFILKRNCPNLETLSFIRGTPMRGVIFDEDFEEDLLYIPPKLKRIHMQRWPCTAGKGGTFEIIISDQKILSVLGQCPYLKYVSLFSFQITESGLKDLTQNTSLKGIDLLDPTPEKDHMFLSSTSTVLDDVLTPSASSMTHIQRFRLNCGPSTMKKDWNITQLIKLPVCISHWTDLKVLTLIGISCSDECFEIMIPGLVNINFLELEGPIVTSNILSMVGKNLKKLTVLKLENGEYSDESLESLVNHPSLEELRICKEYVLQRDTSASLSWLHAIYGVLVTLSKIKHVEMEGYRVLFLHSQESFPIIESAEIVIRNVTEMILMD